MSGGIFCCHNKRGGVLTSTQQVKARDTAKHPTVQKMAPTTENYRVQNSSCNQNWKTLHKKKTLNRLINIGLTRHMSADIIQYEVRCITYKAFWPRVKLEFNQSFIDNQQGPHDFSIKGQRANILGLVGHMVSVMATNCLCSAKAAVNYTERDRNAVFHETLFTKTSGRLDLVRRP